MANHVSFVVYIPSTPVIEGGEIVSDGFSLYMAMGKAVIAPDLPPLADVIDSGVNGRLFDSGGASASDGPDAATAALCAALTELLADAELRARLGAAAREAVGQKHTWQENLRRVMVAAGLEDA